MTASRVRGALTIPALILGIPWNLVIFSLIGVASLISGVVYAMGSVQGAVADWLTEP